jgi:hypothetical protein
VYSVEFTVVENENRMMALVIHTGTFELACKGGITKEILTESVSEVSQTESLEYVFFRPDIKKCMLEPSILIFLAHFYID